MVHLDYRNMQEYFRQTKEFIFLDKVDIEPGESAKGTKLMSSQDWYFQYHFPNNNGISFLPSKVLMINPPVCIKASIVIWRM